MKKLGELQADFLKADFFRLAMAGIYGRRAVYLPDARESEKHRFKQRLMEMADSLLDSYDGPVPGSVHASNIELLSRISGMGLADGHLPFGEAQLFFNLFLKYLWCAGIVGHAPPHCPVDVELMDHVREAGGGDAGIGHRWDMTKEQYLDFMRGVERLTEGEVGPAEWELRLGLAG
jgi:hypothetical protein